MPKTRINCPKCRQPVMAEIDQLFDVGVDPTAKQRLLSGAFNILQCPSCGYQGMLGTPIVYHDAQKELLMTYFPPELNVPRDEQERAIGALINQIINHLPQEGRKGYLLRPQTAFTMQGMIERILEADGITKEMLQAQQERLNIIQRLLNTSNDEAFQEIVTKEDSKINEDFFAMLSRLIESATISGNDEGVQRLSILQDKLLPITTTGKEIQAAKMEAEAAIQSLREMGKDLTREKLLDLVIDAQTDTRLSIFTSLTRPVMDYQFFQLLSEKIDRARGSGRERLILLREKLLDLTREIDQQVEARTIQARKLLQQIINSPNISETIEKNLHVVDDFFLHVLDEEIQDSRKKGDLSQIEKLQRVVDVIQKASAPPPELTLLDEYLSIEQASTRHAWLEAHRDSITPEFISTVTALLSRAETNEEKDLYHRLQEAYRSIVRFSMEANLQAK